MNLQNTFKKLPHLPLYGYNDSFRLKNKDRWYACREQFHTEAFNRGQNDDFYFSYEDITSLSGIIDWAEEVLNLKPEFRTKLYVCHSDPPTEPCDIRLYSQGCAKKDRIVYLEISDFWKSEFIRYYFLTILCRSHLAEWQHPLDAILKVGYCMSTRVATYMFFDGCTKFDHEMGKKNSNWVYLFSEIHNKPDYMKALKRPTEAKERIWFNDNDPTPNLEPFERHRIISWVKEANLSNVTLT